jgi:hypothetical protein
MKNKFVALADMKVGVTEVFAAEVTSMDLPVEMQQSYEALSTAEQDRYQAFFKEKLKKFGADSPADLDDTKKSALFDEVKKDWK